MEKLATVEECTGCAACAQVCPLDAIRLQEAPNGFSYPVISESKCINCGRCSRVCPVLHLQEPPRYTTAYAAYAKEEALLPGSSSGAIFPLLAQKVLEQGGIVFGAAWDSGLRLRHIGIEKAEEIPLLCGSKYVQSEIGKTFCHAKEALEKDRLVYFSGTPCQIAGLQAFLGKAYPNLITQDCVCHSVPSPKVWEDYKQTLEEAYQSKLTGFSFRQKRNGWENYDLCGQFENAEQYLCKVYGNPYMQGFLKGLYSRPSCYDCQFKGIHRHSDLTLADFWGVKGILPEGYNPMGTSLVLLHSEKAQKLFVSLEIAAFAVDPEKAVIYNPAAVHAFAKPKKHDYFQKHYGVKDFAELVRHCCQPTPQEKFVTAWHRSPIYRAIRKGYRMLRR